MIRIPLVAGLMGSLVLLLALPAHAQLDLFSKDQRIEFTPAWQGERFPDGRPDVPDSVLNRLKDVTADEAWDVLQDAGYRNQFESGWKVINPGERLVGRVITAVTAAPAIAASAHIAMTTARIVAAPSPNNATSGALRNSSCDPP